MIRIAVAMLVASILCGCSAKPSAEESAAVAQVEQSKAIAEIKKMGGTVVIDEKSPGKPVISVDLSSSQLRNDGLANVKGLTQLQVLDLSWNEVTDEGLVNLKGLTKLKSLNLGVTRISDAGLANLTGLTSLQSLNLLGTKVTDAGVKGFQTALPNCTISH